MSIDILVVDDSMTIRAMIRKALQLSISNLGKVVEADNGITALARLAENEVDAVLTDINMPRMDGVQLIGRMKSVEKLAKIPIIVISTDDSQERLKYLEGQGISGYLHKPFRPEQLREVLSKILEVTYDEQAVGSDGSDF